MSHWAVTDLEETVICNLTFLMLIWKYVMFFTSLYVHILHILCYIYINYMGAHKPKWVCGHQRITLWSWFSPSTSLWAPGINSGLRACTTNALTCYTILLAHHSCFGKWGNEYRERWGVFSKVTHLQRSFCLSPLGLPVRKGFPHWATGRTRPLIRHISALFVICAQSLGGRRLQ